MEKFYGLSYNGITTRLNCVEEESIRDAYRKLETNQEVLIILTQIEYDNLKYSLIKPNQSLNLTTAIPVDTLHHS